MRKELWTCVMEHEGLIRKCAASMVSIYHVDFDELYDHLCLALYDKVKRSPGLLAKGDGYIFTCLKNEVHSYMRNGMNEDTFADVAPIRAKAMIGAATIGVANRADDTDDNLDRIEAMRFALEHLDDECRELVRAILENSDLIRDSRRERDDRPCRNAINVKALAGRMGKPWRSVYRDVSRLRMQLASSLAIA